jgi:predicted metal-dependent hydrolase
MKEYLLNYQGRSYKCYVTKKRIRNITFRLSRDGEVLKVSCPYGVSDAYLIDKINYYFPRLKARQVVRKPIEGDKVFIFGEEKEIPGFSSFDEKAKETYFKKLLLPYVSERTTYFEQLMNIPVGYICKIRNMSSRYGVNSKNTKSLTFTTSLIHYDPKVIDSVVVHELSHYFEFNHSQKFYAIVYKYCPDYKMYHAKLRKHQYERNDNKQN